MKRLGFIGLLLLIAVAGCGLVPPMAVYGVSSPVGYRADPMGGGGEGLHPGDDLVGSANCPVKAMAPGIVVEHYLVPGWHGGKEYFGHPVYGAMIVIRHADGVFTRYYHLSATYVHEGMRVVAGQVIGRQGNTGVSTGEHLHVELIVSPLLFFNTDTPFGLDSRARMELLR